MTLFKSSPSFADLLLPKKRRIFVSYHHGGDRYFYELFSSIFHDKFELIFDNSVERQIDSVQPTYVMRRIRENYIAGTSCTVVLVGRDTCKRKYVDWEIQTTLEKQHGIVGVQLPSAPINLNNMVHVPSRLFDNISSGYALWIRWDYLIGTPSELSGIIETANSRSKGLINNIRPRQMRNL